MMSQWTTWNWDGAVLLDEKGAAVELNQERTHGGGSLIYRKTNAGVPFVAFFKNNPKKYICSVKLERPGKYRLGESWGHRVMDPSDEKDPVKRVFRELGIPCSERNLTLIKQDFHARLDVHAEAVKHGRCSLIGLGSFERDKNGQVKQAWIYDNADPAELKAWLMSELYGDGSDDAFLEIIRTRDIERARAWVGETFEFTSVLGKGDRLEWKLKISDTPASLHNTLYFRGSGVEQHVVTSNQVLIALANRYGWALFFPFLDDEGHSWMRAMAKVNDAADFIAVRYDVAFVEGFPGFPIRLRPTGDGEDGLFSPLGDATLGGHCEDVMELFNHHGLVKKLSAHTLTRQQQIHDYNEKIAASVREQGSRLLFTTGGGVTLEKSKDDYEILNIGELETVLLRHVAGKPQDTRPCKMHPENQVVAILDGGKALFDTVGKRLILKKADAQEKLTLLLWRGGHYNVASIQIDPSNPGRWVMRNPGRAFEIFKAQKGYFRILNENNEKMIEGHTLAIVSRQA